MQDFSGIECTAVCEHSLKLFLSLNWQQYLNNLMPLTAATERYICLDKQI